MTSDPHFGHLKAASTRGFESTAQHDAAVLDSYLDALGKGDDPWILGDLTAGGRGAEEQALEMLEEIKDEKENA